MVKAVFVMLGLVAAAFAQSSYTGPMFNPSDAPFFGPSSLVIPTLTNAIPTFTQTPTFIRSRTSVPGSVSGSSLVSSSYASSASHSASHSSSASVSASASASRTPSTSVSVRSSSIVSASAPAQSTNAAVVNYPGVVGIVAGGLVAGLAMV